MRVLLNILIVPALPASPSCREANLKKQALGLIEGNMELIDRVQVTHFSFFLRHPAMDFSSAPQIDHGKF
jgi:hypothetical protein